MTLDNCYIPVNLEIIFAVKDRGIFTIGGANLTLNIPGTFCQSSRCYKFLKETNKTILRCISPAYI